MHFNVYHLKKLFLFVYTQKTLEKLENLMTRRTWSAFTLIFRSSAQAQLIKR